jgi:hypothetical protein
MPKNKSKKSSNTVEKPKGDNLDQLKESINKRYEDIEHNFYLIGLDLIKVNLIVKNFRKWVQENTRIDVSTAYTLMRLVKRDKELYDNKKYSAVRPKISFTKLVRLLKYPADFIDKLDFTKEFEAPGGKKFTLLDMPSDLFTEAIAQEYKNLSIKEGGGNPGEDQGLPMDKVIIAQAKEKLDKLLKDLQTVFTVLSEINVTEETNETISTTIDELESINAQAQSINTIVNKLTTALRKQARLAKVA